MIRKASPLDNFNGSQPMLDQSNNGAATAATNMAGSLNTTSQINSNGTPFNSSGLYSQDIRQIKDNPLKIGMVKGNFARVGQDLTSNSGGLSHQYNNMTSLPAQNPNFSQNNFQISTNKDSVQKMQLQHSKFTNMPMNGQNSVNSVQKNHHMNNLSNTGSGMVANMQ